MMDLLSLTLRRDTWPLKVPFTIAHGTKTSVDIISLSLWDKTYTGTGDCRPYARYGETPESVMRQLGALSKKLHIGLTHDEVQNLLPAGAARNALDLALWDLRNQQAGRILDLKPVRTTDTTISIGTPAAMAAAAKNATGTRLKIKLGGGEKNAALEAERLQAVRAAAPYAELIVDANEGWDAAMLQHLVPALDAAKLLLLEQPLPADNDDALRATKLNCPVFADESVHDRASLPALAGKYQGINIKLDKSGGLTEALLIKREAREAGYQIMVGCMVAPSRALIPALLLAQDADFADLDGAALLARDSEPALKYANGFVSL